MSFHFVSFTHSHLQKGKIWNSGRGAAPLFSFLIRNSPNNGLNHFHRDRLYLFVGYINKHPRRLQLLPGQDMLRPCDAVGT